jgi:hypothetical protein
MAKPVLTKSLLTLCGPSPLFLSFLLNRDAMNVNDVFMLLNTLG